MTQKWPTNIGDPRNKNKCFLGGQARFVFLHFYLEIFYMISSFSTFASKVSYSRIKIYYYWTKCAKVGFSGWFFASPNLCPIKKGSPKRGPFLNRLAGNVQISDSAASEAETTEVEHSRLYRWYVLHHAWVPRLCDTQCSNGFLTLLSYLHR